MLTALLQRKKLVVLGLNSGTSADGLDMAAVSIDRSRGGYRTSLIAGGSRRYPDAVRALVLKMADTKAVSLDEVIYLDSILGQFFGRSARAFIKRMNSQGVKVDLIASHGQTVRHRPQIVKRAGFKVRGTLQLGSVDQISCLTNCLAVGNFRQADIAAGNEGAPITVAAMQRLFSDSHESRLIVNIGGMANFFWLPSGRSRQPTVAADCGPGNSLSDILSQELFKTKFDQGGRQALAGQSNDRLLSRLKADPFFKNRTVSTGRETFGAAMAERLIKAGKKLKLSKEDMIATAAELTAVSIAGRVRTFFHADQSLHKLYLTGGGVHNKFFPKRLSELLGGVEVISVAELGYDPDLVEAAAFAVLGEATLRSESVASNTGRDLRQKQHELRPVLGQIVQPPQKG
jgi:anhydro-N-acetylmuramic acid kinase